MAEVIFQKVVRIEKKIVHLDVYVLTVVKWLKPTQAATERAESFRLSPYLGSGHIWFNSGCPTQCSTEPETQFFAHL